MKDAILYLPDLEVEAKAISTKLTETAKTIDTYKTIASGISVIWKRTQERMKPHFDNAAVILRSLRLKMDADKDIKSIAA